MASTLAAAPDTDCVRAFENSVTYSSWSAIFCSTRVVCMAVDDGSRGGGTGLLRHTN